MAQVNFSNTLRTTHPVSTSSTLAVSPVDQAIKGVMSAIKNWAEDEKLRFLAYAWGGNIVNNADFEIKVYDIFEIPKAELAETSPNTAEADRRQFNDGVRVQVMKALHLPLYLEAQYMALYNNKITGQNPTKEEKTQFYEKQKQQMLQWLSVYRLSATLVKGLESTDEALKKLAATWGDTGKHKEFMKDVNGVISTHVKGMKTNTPEYHKRLNAILEGVRSHLVATLSINMRDAYDQMIQSYKKKEGGHDFNSNSNCGSRNKPSSLEGHVLDFLETELKGTQELRNCGRNIYEPRNNPITNSSNAVSNTSNTSNTTTTSSTGNKSSPTFNPMELGSYLNGFIDKNETISNPKEIKSIQSMMERYNSKFNNKKKRIAGVDAILMEHMKQSGKNPADFIKTIKIYSDLNKTEAEKMAFMRDLVNIKGAREFDNKSNQSILGCEQSYISSNTKVRKPGNQVSVEMRAPFCNPKNKEVVSPILLSVSAPALDIKTQPEWNEYVDSKGKLIQKNFELALTKIASHVRACAHEHPDHRVVLSAFGMNNFIAGLTPDQQEVALAIGHKAYAQMIGELRASGKEVVFSDRDDTSPFWKDVNISLQALSSSEAEPIAFVGSMPGDWMNNKDIIVNAWDPNSVIGNGCNEDRSFDGAVGTHSLCHYLHTLACAMFSHELFNAPVVNTSKA
jgi:hypothetical protein